jgi:hypothetical protein
MELRATNQVVGVAKLITKKGTGLFNCSLFSDSQAQETLKISETLEWENHKIKNRIGNIKLLSYVLFMFLGVHMNCK